MKVRVGSLEEQRQKLDRLCRETSQWIYPQPYFLDFLGHASRARAEVVIAEERGFVLGALPFLTLDRPGLGRVVNSLPWWGSHGGCILDAAQANADAIRHALLTKFKATIRGPDLLSGTIILPHSEEGAAGLYDSALSPATTDYRIGQITELPLTPGPEGACVMARFTQKTRNQVRKALKQEFVERVSDDDDAWDFLHRTHTKNIEALGGKPKPRDHFEHMRRTLPPAVRRLSLAIDGGRPVAALLLLFGGRSVEYVTPAVEVSARSRQPLSFLIWHGMIDAIEQGRARWNWGGTWVGQRSLHHFKAGFGAKDHRYSYFTMATPEGVTKLRAHRAELGTLFPYFYTYPYAALADPS